LPLYKTGTVSNPVINIETANKFRLGAVQVGTNLDLSGVGVIDVLQSTTTQKGVVQLADNVSTPSQFLALTANQGYLLQQQINSLSFATDLIFSGTFDPTVPEMVNVTTKGQEAGFVQGANLPLPSTENESHFVIVSERGIYTPPGSVTPVDAHVGSWFVSNATEWRYLKINEQVPSATETNEGIIRLATLQEAIDGVNDTAAITSCKMAQVSVEKCNYTAKGDILAATGAGTPTALPVGSDSQFLSANSACPEGLEWVDQPPAIPCSVIGNQGSIVVGTGPSTPSSLPLGLGNQYLRVNYSCPTGLEWVTVTNTFAIPCSILTEAGTLVTADGPSNPIALPRGTKDQILTVCPACVASGGLLWTDNPSINQSYLLGQSKGSLIVSTGVTGAIATQLGVGDNPAANGLALVSCNVTSTGLCWAKASPPESCFTALGQLYVGTGPNGLCALAPGADGQVLTANSSSTTGVEWATVSSALPFANERLEDGGVVMSDTSPVIVSYQYKLLPLVNYPSGLWLINVWGEVCSGGNAQGWIQLFCGQGATFCGMPLVEFWMPNTRTTMPISTSAVLSNANDDLKLQLFDTASAKWCYALSYSAIKVG
jgi:hypothetical protein